MSELDILLCGQLVGHIRRGDGNQYHFRYSSERAPGNCLLSCSLPPKVGEYSAKETRSFFRGLLPEGARREAYARHLKIETDDDYALLETIGGDCAGAVQVIGETDLVVQEDIVYPRSELSTFCDHVRSGMLIRQRNRLSLTGAQLKEAVVIDEAGVIRIPRDGRPSTHILKVPPQPGTGYESIVYNEYFCLKLAKHVSSQIANCFEVCEASLLPFKYFKTGNEAHVLCLDRFDRERGKNGKVTRTHQEDFCQAIGTTNKYQHSGGPSFHDLASLCDVFTKMPGLERLKLFYAGVLNILLGNCDAHGRNFSIRHPEHMNISLTPLYDLVCTCVYPGLDRTMAMSIADSYELDDMDRESLGAFADSLGLSATTAKKYAEDFISIVADSVDVVRSWVPEDDVVDNVVQHIKHKASILQS